MTTDSTSLPGYYLVHCILAILSVVCEEANIGCFKSSSEIDDFSKEAGFVGGVAEMCDLIGLDVIARASCRYEQYQKMLGFLYEVGVGVFMLRT